MVVIIMIPDNYWWLSLSDHNYWRLCILFMPQLMVVLLMPLQLLTVVFVQSIIHNVITFQLELVKEKVVILKAEEKELIPVWAKMSEDNIERELILFYSIRCLSLCLRIYKISMFPRRMARRSCTNVQDICLNMNWYRFKDQTEEKTSSILITIKVFMWVSICVQSHLKISRRVISYDEEPIPNCAKLCHQRKKLLCDHDLKKSKVSCPSNSCNLYLLQLSEQIHALVLAGDSFN